MWRHSWLWSWEGTLAFGPPWVGAFESHVHLGCDIWEGVETSKRLSSKLRLYVRGSGGTLGRGLSHWGLLLFVMDPAVADSAGRGFLRAGACWRPAKGYLCCLCLKRTGNLRSQHGLSLGFRGFVTPTASLWCLAPKFPSPCFDCSTQPKLPKPRVQDL